MANTAPVANAQSVSTNEDTAKTIVLSGGDAEANALTYSIVAGPVNGTLSGTAPNVTYTPAANSNGADAFTFKVNDGTVDSPVATVTLSVASVNDAPSFTAGGDRAAAQDAGPQTLRAWATAISAGPADESAQTVTFTVTSTNSALFASPPALAPDGTLTFAPAPQGSGTAIVTVIAQDSGGLANGGVNVSAPVTFKIAITTNAAAGGTYNGLAQAAPFTPQENARAGVIKVKVGKKGIFTGSLKMAGANYPLRGRFDHAGVAHFGLTDASTFTLLRKDQPPLVLTLQVDVAVGNDQLAGRLTDAGADFAVIAADRALYTAARRPAAPLRTTPAQLPGRYTVAFNTVDLTRPASTYPQGDGVGILTVNASGTARFAGTLADGTAITSANALSKNNTLPLYASFAAGRGSISGPLTFRDVRQTSDLDSSSLHWFKPADALAKYYPAGWPQGLSPSLVGCKFFIPAATPPRSVLPGLISMSPAGNADVALTDGNLPQTIAKAVNVNLANLVSVAVPGADRLIFRLRIYDLRPNSPNYKELISAVGVMEGSFVHPGMAARASFKGIVLQKQGMGTGFFLGTTESGAVTLTLK